MNPEPRLFLIDASSYIYRAFFALPHLSNSKGLPTNAVYGFTQMLLKVIKDHQPTHLALIFDSKAPSFRKKIYQDYKANRAAMPDELQERLINWGYAVCDAALRKHVDSRIDKPVGFPYPAAGV